MNAPDKRSWLEGGLAIEIVRSILCRNGLAAVDFETWPDPNHEIETAVARVPRGGKRAARKKAVLEFTRAARARDRLPCTLQVVHANGSEVFCRLTDPAHELPAMFAPVVDLRPWEDGATLVAFNAQFETEVLLAHGVRVAFEDPMLAAKALYLTAVPEDRPQPVRFSLAALVERELGRQRDKTVRSRDWRRVESLDAEGVEYGLQDARDCLELWRWYAPQLEQAGLMTGYRVMVEAAAGTAASNLVGLLLDGDAHQDLIQDLHRRMAVDAERLDRACGRAITSHGSTAAVSAWIIGQVVGYPVRAPDEPKLVGLTEFLIKCGGLRPDRGGELAALGLPSKALRLDGALSIEDATLDAWHAGYIGDAHSTFDDTRPEQDELLAALVDELAGDRVLTQDDDREWRLHLEARSMFDELHRDDPHLRSNFAIRLRARAGTGWRWTDKTGNLAVTKGSMRRKAEQLVDAFPDVAEYLVARLAWNKSKKLIEAFGPALRRWVDEDGRVRGQFRLWAAVTGRQSCVNPNLQQMPRDPLFRALFKAPPGRKLIVCDYSQIEMRLAAVFAPDPVLLEVYRTGADIHAVNAAIIYGVPLAEVTKDQRQAAKPVGFAVIYGAGAAGLAESTGVELARARVFLERFLGTYRGLAAYRERAVADARGRGCIHIEPARRVWVDAKSPATAMINYPIQGAAASVQMRAVRRVHDALEARPGLALLCASVHDEIILEAADADADAAKALLQHEMRAALVDVVPATVDMGADALAEAAVVSSWAEKP